MPTDRLLRLPAVQDATGLSRSMLYDLMANNDFPRPVRLGLRAVGWRESDITRWIDTRQKTEA